MPRAAAAVAPAATRYDRRMIRRLVPSLVIAAALAACAGLTQPTPPPVIPRTTVTADPADARCRVIGAVARQDARPTPLTIDTLAFGLPVTVTCERVGFQPTSETLHPRPLPTLVATLTAGRLLAPMAEPSPPFGVPPGSPGASALTLRLRPALVSPPPAHDRFFERLRAEREERWRMIADRLEGECARRTGAPATVPGPTPAACRAARDALAQQRADDLRGLEIDRRRATFQ